MAHKVAVYIDGFNLFYGMRSKGWKQFYWLDVHQLAENLLRPSQQLAVARYFTAPILHDPSDPDKDKRQETYLDALSTIPKLDIQKGYYISKRHNCLKCGMSRTTYEEKTTDVNIAVAMLTDAFDNIFDTAILVSADGDLVRPVTTILARFPNKRVVVAFPPARNSNNLRKNASASISIWEKTIAKSQLPSQIVGLNGHILNRPPSWI